jgi:DNA-binding protein HU-beta
MMRVTLAFKAWTDQSADAIVKTLKKEGGFTLPSFGTFTVRKTKAREALNPRTSEPVQVKAGKTDRFEASPTLTRPV